MFYLAFILYCIILTYYGFIVKRPNWLGWFMFSRGSYCYTQLKVGEKDLNIWDYLPHGQVIIHEDMMFKLLKYLRDYKKMNNIEGTFTLKKKDGNINYEIKDSFIKKRYVDFS